MLDLEPVMQGIGGVLQKRIVGQAMRHHQVRQQQGIDGATLRRWITGVQARP